MLCHQKHQHHHLIIIIIVVMIISSSSSSLGASTVKFAHAKKDNAFVRQHNTVLLMRNHFFC